MTDLPISPESAGDRHAAADLMPPVYGELRRLAAAKLAHEPDGHTLDATALVHEAFLRLGGGRSFATKDAFLRAAAEAMRRILVDHARSKRSDKRGGDRRRVSLDDASHLTGAPEDLLDLDEVLERFAAEEPRKAELVVLRFFGGMTIPEAAAALGVSVPTAERWWSFARVWLYSGLEGNISGNP